jgi:hypothetical protein
MKQMKLLYATLLAIIIAFYSTITVGEETKRVWQLSECFTFRLAVRDKMLGGEFTAKYVVRSSDGTTFIAEKRADDFESSRVLFPDDFYDEKTKLKAWIICDLMTYKWYIYADNTLVDKGIASFAREGVKK